MLRNAPTLLITLLLGAVMLLAACGGDDDGNGDDAGDSGGGGNDATAASGGNSGGSNSGGSSSGGGGSTGGTLTLGDEVINLDSARCFLQEQDVVGSPGKILLTGQGFGTNADGEELILDFTRFDEDSDFTGDDILVDIGDFRSGDAQSYMANADLGTVQRDGDTLSADGLTFQNFDAGIEVMGSFKLEC